MSCSRLLLGLASGLSTCGDLAPQHEDGGCLFSVTHHLTLQLMYSRRSRCRPNYTADMHAMFDDVVQYLSFSLGPGSRTWYTMEAAACCWSGTPSEQCSGNSTLLHDMKQG